MELQGMSENLQHQPNEAVDRKKHEGALTGAADFLKSQYIGRWGIVCTAKEQSIGQHMYNVWLLTRQWGPLVLGTPTEQRIAEELALTHDLAEIRTGDCPTPFKTPDVKQALNELEISIYNTVPAPAAVKDLVKFCDTAESILFLKLYGLGRHAYEVRELLCQQMWTRLERSLFSTSERNLLRDYFTDTFHDT
jgi:hypothetical protein